MAAPRHLAYLKAMLASLMLAVSIAGHAIAQDASPPVDAPSTYLIDLATTLRLAGAQNLDVQLARGAVDEAQANYTSAVERFPPYPPRVT
jgi:hypothetical protein